MGNPYIESYIGRLREDCLNRYSFARSQVAQLIREPWHLEYKLECPHSSLRYLKPTEFVGHVPLSVKLILTLEAPHNHRLSLIIAGKTHAIHNEHSDSLPMGCFMRFRGCLLAVLLSIGACTPSTPTPTPTAEPTTRTFDDGIVMVQVPAGCFQMGSEQGAGDERPVHQQCFDSPFWIDRTEVTQGDFDRLAGVKSDSQNAPQADHPVTRINWFEARDFCALRSARLPTEVEWEYAARGPENQLFPWGTGHRIQRGGDQGYYSPDYFSTTRRDGRTPSSTLDGGGVRCARDESP
ncbi:MAG: SUMF1/EgtB/PvdO family nonheme iron enzyme [Chloroflexi bacterium]|nr:SUMF1/EgtB/PvdO family nonheme iron enzyme [Chloroflexota bacterium]